MAIATQNVLPRQDDTLERNPDVDGKSNDAGEWHRGRDRTEDVTVGSCDQFSFPEVEKNDGFFDIADTERLVIVIENEHLAT